MSAYKNEPVDLTLDVRSKLEFWLGHLPTAVNIPVDHLPDALGSVPGITRTSRILVYCASGGRSAQAAAILAQQGYKHVIDGGGMSDAKPHFRAD